jgi:hypothetical protein
MSILIGEDEDAIPDRDRCNTVVKRTDAVSIEVINEIGIPIVVTAPEDIAVNRELTKRKVE